MTQRDAFSRGHPAVLLSYFAAVITLAAFLRAPVCVAISLVCAIAYALFLDLRRSASFLLRFCLPVFVLTAAINPLFNHRGVTVLARFPSGNTLTLESILYGAFSAMLLVSVLMWFSILSRIVTSDMIIWLVGRFAPTGALLLSMTLRFVPEFRRRFAAVRKARRALYAGDGEKPGAISRTKDAFSCFSTVMTWSLESSIVTGDSMRSRGYASGRRTSYSLWRFGVRDAAALSAIALLTAATVTANALGLFDWDYYPRFVGNTADIRTVTAQAAYLLLCLVPLIADGREAIKWRYLRSTR